MSIRVLALGVAVLVFTTGCSSKPNATVGDSASQAAPTEPVANESIPSLQDSTAQSSDGAAVEFKDPFADETPVSPANSGIAGRWLLALPREAAVAKLWLIEITEKDDTFECKLLDQSLQVRTDVREFAKSGETVRFKLLLGDQFCPFEGQLKAGNVIGTLQLPDRVTIAWLERTEFRSMRNVRTTVPAQGSLEFDTAQRHDDPKLRVKQLMNFANEFSTSPLAFDAIQTVLRLVKPAELSGDEVGAIASKYEELSKPWGRLWSETAVESTAYHLATADVYPGMALEFAERALAALPESGSEGRRQMVELTRAIALLRNDRAAESKELLEKLRETQGDDPERSYYLALATEQTGDLDAAIETLVALWPHPVATRDLSRVWIAKHGSRGGLESRLDTEYLKRYPPIAAEPYAGRPENGGSHVVLVELFTGTSCPPCVAADTAFEALSRAFKPTELVLLQYHLHVPGPDPLTNGDSETRAEYYNVPGTPVLFVDGKAVAPVGGGRRDSSDRYQNFRGVVEKELTRAESPKIELAANRSDDLITIEAKLSGITVPTDTLRLRLAIVEKTVRFSGLNGIRFHHAVVRAMPGGARGVAVPDPEMTHKVVVKLSELRQELDTAMANVEKLHGFEFPEKPLDLEHLGVVAFLQSDDGHDVFQSRFVPLRTGGDGEKDAARPSNSSGDADASSVATHKGP